ncbi:ring box 1; RING box protein 1; regulator of [Trichuris trichiura]|uniref:Ring box 1 RING box protein 1 regulator of n=1 Tax=Trichuris trichiura TaxID=36087 RepID=A0A077Z9H0_TRITR|nr:ring box 1; RING box protein 1; regulator of [Trichuris trichiura]
MSSDNSTAGDSALFTAEKYSVDESDADGKIDVANTANQLPRFQITKFVGVALWSYDIKNDWCAICHCTINELCLACQTEDAKDSSQLECPPTVGVCTHTFHDHCINRWLRTQRVCPLDNQQWRSQHSEADN